ncbi:ATP-binding cassette domain-containing protein [Candidatus Bathyarchaeota archaeon]|nr:ATP-binding cassette domain-containing protein [Candidatus Bathyarchaeota archaeon]
MIKAEKVNKEYNRSGTIIRALIDIDLEIYSGEVVAIQGPTACGKTTLLNVLSGLDTPDDGKVFLDGENISRSAEKRLSTIRSQKIGFVFQDFNLIDSLTAIENVSALLWPTPLHKKDIEKRALAALRDVNMLERKDHIPRQLSGGEKQRVAVARAIVHQPRVIFADEPTGNLDPQSGKELMDLLVKLNKDYKTTVVIVTHDQQIADKYGKKRVRMDRGKIVDIS